MDFCLCSIVIIYRRRNYIPMSNKKQAQYNGLREYLAKVGTKSQRRKKYRAIIEELGQRNISLDDLQDPFNSAKSRGFIDLLDTTDATLDDLVVLQQYANAIIDRDTRSAEFLRDTSGQKPTADINVNATANPLSELSLDELKAIAAYMRANGKTE